MSGNVSTRAATAPRAVLEISKRTLAGLVTRRVADMNARLQEWQERWTRCGTRSNAIIAERGEEMSELQVGDGEEPHYVAGGSTGFIVKDLKGKEADKPVYRIDSGVLQMVHALIEIGKHVAMELGQWTDRKRFFEVEDDDIVRPDLNKLTDEKMTEFTRLSKRRPQARKVQ